MTTVAYWLLNLAASVCSSVIMFALFVNSPLYVKYHVVNARGFRAHMQETARFPNLLQFGAGSGFHERGGTGATGRSRHVRTAARRISQPTDVMSHEEKSFIGSTRMNVSEYRRGDAKGGSKAGNTEACGGGDIEGGGGRAGTPIGVCKIQSRGDERMDEEEKIEKDGKKGQERRRGWPVYREV